MKLLTTLAVITMMAVPTIAHAQYNQYDNPSAPKQNVINPFLETTIGRVSVEGENITSVREPGYAYERSETGVHVSLGLRHPSGIMGGLAFNFFGSDAASIRVGNQVVTADSKAYSYGPFIAYDYRIPGAWRFSVIPKVGLHIWEVDVNARSGSASVDTTYDGTDPYFGIDFAYRLPFPIFNDRTTLSIGFDRYKLEDTDVDYLHFGIMTYFF